ASPAPANLRLEPPIRVKTDRKFAGLSAGGRWIRTFGPSRKGAAVSASHHAEFLDDPPFRIADWGEFHTLPRNHVSSRDRDFRPTRRRDFDDDNFETPRRSFGSTSGSSIQRFETPPGPPVQAVVKWYNADKGFGFVQLANGSGDAFLHVQRLFAEVSGSGTAKNEEHLNL